MQYIMGIQTIYVNGSIGEPDGEAVGSTLEECMSKTQAEIERITAEVKQADAKALASEDFTSEMAADDGGGLAFDLTLEINP